MRPTKYLLAAALALCAGAGTAHAKTFHYACKSGEDRYALTVNTDRHQADGARVAPHAHDIPNSEKWPRAASMAGH
jgi:hypothetical protein